ncbi:MAG: TIGR03086 family metal-binding protein [Microthrixaceae bacterium]|nr:TIGR03086 family protein [Microthrixaceae bacterium]MCO5318982.1 TIGR03086 family metal-binding protein [Microthrixaceae bacterium]
MDDLELLELASAAFGARIAEVDQDQQFLPTPCGEWNVAGLITHVLGGNHMAVRLLEGAHRAEAIGYLTGLPLGDDPAATFAQNAAAQLAAFSEPGALERTCEHPMGDLPGAVVLGFRIGDLTLHSWDLARAVGGDEELPEALIDRVWSDLVPLRDNIAATGIFGEGPSGEVPDDAPLQTRLLDLTGRRP